MLDAEMAQIDALITKNQTVLRNLDQRIVSLRAELLWPTEACQAWTGSPLDAPTSAVSSATKVQYVVPVRVAGGTPPTGVDAYWSEDLDALPWFGVGDFGHGQETGSPSRRVTEAGVTAAALKVMQRGDLLLAMYGATSGKAGVLSEPGTTNQAVMAMRSDPRVLRQDYLIEWFNFASPYAYEKAESRSSTQPNLNAGQIEQFSIRCPSLAEQDAATKALAHVRETADALRKRVERQIDLLRTRRQSLITAAVTGQITV
jgi:type I restriction enzyme, S subunit